jgi:hypothetical protein
MVIKDISLELHAEKFQLHEKIHSIMDPSPLQNNKTLEREIKVNLPYKKGHIFARVSEEDYEMVKNASSAWRQSDSGYPIFVRRIGNTFQTTYMHKLIFGSGARHIDGDRMNNTRQNLTSTQRSNRKRKPKTYWDNDMIIEFPLDV